MTIMPGPRNMDDFEREGREQAMREKAAKRMPIVVTLREMAAAGWAERYEHSYSLTEAADMLERQEQRILQLEASRQAINGPDGSAIRSTFHRICALEDQAAKDGDWETAFNKMCQRANTLSKIIDGEHVSEIATQAKDAIVEQCAGICEVRAGEWDSSVREGSEQHAYETAVLLEVAGRIRSLKGAL